MLKGKTDETINFNPKTKMYSLPVQTTRGKIVRENINMLNIFYLG